jgi:hypothetical protein
VFLWFGEAEAVITRYRTNLRAGFLVWPAATLLLIGGSEGIRGQIDEVFFRTEG